LTGILAGINAITIFFFFEETQYLRNNNTNITADKSHDLTAVETDASVTNTIRKKTFLQRIKPWSGIHPTTSYLSFFVRPWPLLAYPAVLYSLVTFSTAASWSICLLDTYASVFQRPPYNLSPGINSLIYISGIIGLLLGSYMGGPLTDKMAEWYARKHNGVFEPEVRLVAMIIPFFVVPAGLLMYILFIFDLILGMVLESNIKRIGLYRG